VKQQYFEQQYAPIWQQFANYLQQLERGEVSAVAFLHSYRQICHHLALARSRNYSPSLVAKLNNLVLRGHQQLYKQRQRHLLSLLIQFIGRDFPQAVRREWRFVVLAAAIFFLPLIIMAMTVYWQPSLIYSLISELQVYEFERMYDPNEQYERNAADNFLMFGYYIYNNTSIGFQVFAGGMAFGVGSIFFMLFNAIYIGAIAGYLLQLGYATPFLSFVAGHGSLELMAIVIAGATGLKLGWALIAPQRFSRMQALKNAAKHSVVLLYGIILMFFLAAFVEAFWSPLPNIAPIIKYIVGIILWILVISYFIFVGSR
jgi:uncharacterized membrane protein SpoIIM required for sporulation